MADTNVNFKPPTYAFIIRRVQLVVGLGVLGIAAWLDHKVVTDEVTFAIVCGVFTSILCVFAIVSAKQSSMSGNLTFVLLVMIGDGVMALFWLSSMSSNVSLRARFHPVQTCYDAYGYEYLCNKKRSDPLFLVAGPVALDLLDTVAGLSGLELILFIASFFIMLLHYRAKSAAIAANQPTIVNVEPKAEQPVTEMLPGTVLVQQGGMPMMGAAPPQYIMMQQPMQMHQPMHMQHPGVMSTPSPVFGQTPVMHQPQPVYPVPPQATMSPPPQEVPPMQHQNGISPLSPPTQSVTPHEMMAGSPPPQAHEMMATPLQQSAHPAGPPPQS